jgi:hypothetical protein
MEQDLNPLVIAIIVVAALVIGLLIWQLQRTRALRGRYAGEYDRTVSSLGRRAGEAELVKREVRVRELHIRPVSATERERFVAEWRRVQEQFVDDPRGAVTRGNDLVEEVLRARGYPTSDFDRQVADISVDHPRVVENYRRAREIGVRHQRGEASTEDLRQAMVLYRELFEDLIERDDSQVERVVTRPVERDAMAEVADGGRRRSMNPEVRP